MAKTNTRKHTLTFRLKTAEKEALERAATAADMSTSEMIRDIIIRHLDYPTPNKNNNDSLQNRHS